MAFLKVDNQLWLVRSCFSKRGSMAEPPFDFESSFIDPCVGKPFLVPKLNTLHTIRLLLQTSGLSAKNDTIKLESDPGTKALDRYML